MPTDTKDEFEHDDGPSHEGAHDSDESAVEADDEEQDEYEDEARVDPKPKRKERGYSKETVRKGLRVPRK